MKRLQRIWRSFARDEDAFFEIGLDKKESLPAVGLTLLAGAAGGLRWVLENGNPFALQVSLLIGSCAGWFVFTEAIHFVEMLWAGGGMQRKELLRLSGFSALPLAFLSIPYIGWLGVVWFWVLIYTAIRSLYSTKPRHTIVLIGLGSLAALTAWGMTVLLVNTVLTGGS
jgi:hypothetical protein